MSSGVAEHPSTLNPEPFTLHSDPSCQARGLQAGGKQVSKTFWRRLTWRDLAYWQLHHFPEMSTQPIRSHYADQVGTAQRTVRGSLCTALRRYERGVAGSCPLVASMADHDHRHVLSRLFFPLPQAKCDCASSCWLQFL